VQQYGSCARRATRLTRVVCGGETLVLNAGPPDGSIFSLRCRASDSAYAPFARSQSLRYIGRTDKHRLAAPAKLWITCFPLMRQTALLVLRRPQLFRATISQMPCTSSRRLGVQVPRRGHHSDAVRPYLRAANVRRGNLDLTDLKTMEVTDAVAQALRLEAGDLLFVEGSGSLTEVGRCAHWSGEVANCIHQNSVVRARIGPRGTTERKGTLTVMVR
jgi:hypothetical protein